MPLNNQQPARDAGYQNIQYLKRNVLFGSTGAFVLGRIPAGSIIVAPISGVDVSTVFNAGTANTVSIGIAGTPAKYASASSLAAVGFVPMAVAVGHKVTVDTDILVTPAVTGTAPTTGDADVVLAFIPPN